MKRILPFLLFFISTLSFGQNINTDDNQKMIIGKWVSEDDKRYVIVVTESTFIEYYEHKKTNTYSYKIEKDRLIKTQEDGDIYEYDITNLSDKYLTLMYLPRGNTLIFKKKSKK